MKTPFKKNGNLKAQYKDLPRYKLIVTYEKYFQNAFRHTIQTMTKQVMAQVKSDL